MAEKAKKLAISPRLNTVRQLFTRWRAGKGGRGRRIPADLWAAAGEVAEAEGVYRVSQVLGLDYARLKQRAADAASAQGAGPDVTFVELSRAAVGGSGTSEAVIELQRGDGARMRMELSGRPELDVAALVKAMLDGGQP